MEVENGRAMASPCNRRSENEEDGRGDSKDGRAVPESNSDQTNIQTTNQHAMPDNRQSYGIVMLDNIRRNERKRGVK